MSSSKRAIKGLQSLLAITVFVSQFLLPWGAAAADPALPTASSPNIFPNSILKNPATASAMIVPNATGGPDGGGYLFNQSTNVGLPAGTVAAPDALPNTFIAGENMSVMVGVSNLGPGTATNAEVQLMFPADIYYLDSTGTCTLTGSNPDIVDCALGDMDPGEIISFQVNAAIDATVLQADPDGTEAYTISTALTTTAVDATLEVNELSFFVTESADLRIEKFAAPSNEVEAGEQFTYTILVDNLGPSTARNIVITDTLVTSGFVDANGCSIAVRTENGAIDEFVCNFALSTGVFDLGTFGSNWLNPRSPTDMGRIVITINGTAEQALDMTNTATVTSDTPDPEMDNNIAITTLSVSAVADLALSKTASAATVFAGETLTYSLAYTNTGPSRAENVVIADNLPAEVEILSVSSSAGSCVAGTPGVPADPTICFFGNTSVGGSESMTVVVKVKPEAVTDVVTDEMVMHNDAMVFSDIADPSNADNLAHVATTVQASADLALQIFTVGSPTAGEIMHYEYQIANLGPSVSRDVTLRDFLPDEVEFVDAFVDLEGGTGSIPLACDITQGSNALFCPLGDIPLTDGVPIFVFVNFYIPSSIPEGTVLANSASVFLSDTPDPDGTNNSDTTAVPVQTFTDLLITKDAHPATPVAGNTFSFEITVQNNGPSDAFDLEVSDTLPAGFTYLTSDVACSEALGVVTCRPSGTAFTSPPYILPAGESVTFDLHLEIAPNVVGEFFNLANATVGNTSFAITSIAESVYVTSQADLNIVMFSSPDAEVMAGEQFTYTILVDNYGPSSAHNVVITDTLISSGFVQANGCSLSVRTDGGAISEFNCNFALSIGVFDLATMGSNWLNPRSPSDEGRIIITINARANQALDLNNYATVTSDSLDPDMSNNSATDLLSVLAAADLSIEKTVNAVELTAGELATYTLTVYNAGPSTASNVVVVDQLPAGVTLTDISWDVPGSCLGTETVTCYFGNMAVGTMATIVIEVMVQPDLPDGTLLQNTAMVSSDAYDLDTSDNADMVMAGIGATADLSISKVADPVVAVMGEQIEYTIVVMNHGPSDVFGGMIMDLVPEGLEDVTWECKTYAGWCPAEGDGDIEEYFDLPAGEHLTLTVWGTLATNRPVTNEATVLLPDDVIDPDFLNNVASVTNTPYTLYLPSIFGRTLRVFEPDLVVTSLVVNSFGVEVRIKNVGLAPVTEPFWVDVMLDPIQAPWLNNQIWATLSAEGLTWGVGAHALPLNPGDELTLVVGDQFFWGLGSYVAWPIEAGTAAYAHVDSWHVANEYGAVLEDHEVLGKAYNNVFGPGFSVMTLIEAEAPAMNGTPFGFGSLPER